MVGVDAKPVTGFESSRSLDPENLRTLPSLRDRVKDFITFQARHANAYAEQGRRECAQWSSDAQPGVSTPPRKQAVLVNAFDTPIVKPRVPLPDSPRAKPMPEARRRSFGGGGAVTSAVADAHHGETAETNEVKRGKRRRGDVARAEKAWAGVKKARGSRSVQMEKRRKMPTSSEVDHAGRLADRRERKRARKAIGAPPKRHTPPSSAIERENGRDDDTSVASEPIRKKTKLKARNAEKYAKPKRMSAGLALMYGFSSTSVGSNRLTIQPPTQHGLFRRGRASVKTKVVSKSVSGLTSKLFSEDTFLNKTDKELVKRHATPPAPSSSSSYTSSSNTPSGINNRSRLLFVKGTIPRRTGHSESFENGGASVRNKASPQPAGAPSSQAPDTRSQASLACSKSWAIEDGGSLPIGSSPSTIQRSAVVNMREHPLSKRLGGVASREVLPDTTSASLRQQAPSSCAADAQGAHSDEDDFAPSLAPSESISRVLQRARDVVTITQFSKYFPRPILGYQQSSAAGADLEKPDMSVNISSRDRPVPQVVAPSLSQRNSLTRKSSQTPQPGSHLPHRHTISTVHDPATESSKALSRSQRTTAHPMDTEDFTLKPAASPSRSHEPADRSSSPESLDLALQAMSVPDPSLRYTHRRSNRRMRAGHSSPDPRSVSADLVATVPEQAEALDAAGYDDYTFMQNAPLQLFEDYSDAELCDEAAYEAMDVERSSSIFVDSQLSHDLLYFQYPSPEDWDNAKFDIPAEIAQPQVFQYQPSIALHGDDACMIMNVPTSLDTCTRNAVYPAVSQQFQDPPEWLSWRSVATRFVPRTTFNAEEDVARKLAGHWLPQRL
ncbi:hypothetical protein K488DRAFT_90123 [Vararia minispora EC-137]|uniref:Uncharacterized protein n=1 Tax=Vararia minispora EC-137 TaxID=1314806 RepID=A0ACB8Q9Z2_9AGAM|nr:hypothetical protein K488DRAFT_90123 [Vararia minispora EC-137]